MRKKFSKKQPRWKKYKQQKAKAKAQKKAKETIINKYFPKYKDMDMMGRYRIDQIVATKYGAAITKIALKIMPKMKAMEVEKVKQARQAKQDA